MQGKQGSIATSAGSYGKSQSVAQEKHSDGIFFKETPGDMYSIARELKHMALKE